MKTIVRLLAFLLLAPLALATNTTIEALSTTITLPRTGDYIPASNGTTTAKFLFSGITFLTGTRTTLAALSVTTAVDGTGIVVLGASSVGDGGGATYYYNASSTQTPNGNTIIQPSSLPFAGRWIKAVGGVGAPGVSTLGGIFSNSGATSKWVSAINTDGSVTLTQPSASDILGLGTMATQSSSSVAITGGAIDGATLGATTPLPAGTFTALTTNLLTTNGNALIGTGSGNRSVIIYGGNVAGQGAGVFFERNAVNVGYVGTDSGFQSSNSSDISIGGMTGQNLRFYANNVQQGFITTSGELNMGFGIFSKAVAQYDASSGALYLGYGAGTAIIRSVADNGGSYAPISVQTGNGNQQATFTNLGMTMYGVLNFDTAAHLVTTKQAMNLIVNVKDWGAKGDNSTNDTLAINTAISHLVSYGTLYFPAGRYLINDATASLTGMTGLNNVTICGDGYASEIHNVTTGASGNTIVVDNTCSYFTIRDLSFTGSATSRGSGIHIRLGASHSTIHDCFFQGCSDFAVLVGNFNAFINDVAVNDCVAFQTLGDGYHFGGAVDSSSFNCRAISTGDDGMGIGGDYAGYGCNRLEVVGFQSYQPGNFAGGGTHGCGIRIFDGCTDIHIVGGECYQPCECGIFTGRAVSTTAYNARVVIDEFKVMYPMQVAGQIGGITISTTDQCELNHCTVDSPVSQGCFAFWDNNDLSVDNCVARNAVLRAYVTADFAISNLRSTWSNWSFTNNKSFGAPSNETIYMVPMSGKTISNLIITGTTDNGGTAATYISTNFTGGVVKIGNNISRGGKAIVFGGTGVTPTTFNNN